MDVSAFDFELDEVRDLLAELAELATSIELEPRLHQDDEVDGAGNPLHEPRSTPTFRIQIRILSGEDVIGSLHSLQTKTGLEIVLDQDRIARVRHRKSRAAA
jgi:hypothetical protein